MISKSYRKNKSVLWLPIAFVLVLSVVLYSGSVFSEGDIKRIVTFEGNEWDISDENSPVWLTNKDNLTFTVDLSEDYQNYLKSLEPEPTPEPEPQPDPEPGTGEGEPGTPEDPENPAPETGGNTEPVASSTENEETVAPPEVKQPFKVTVDEKQATVKVNESGDTFSGVYEVVVTLPADLKDKDIPVSLDFAENNWNIPTETKGSVKFERDKTAPGIKLSGVAEDAIENNEASLTIEINDSNYDPNQVVVTAKQDDKDFIIENEPDWTSGKGTINFTQAGDYVVTITATDKAGNVTQPVVREFSIYKRAASFNIINERANQFYNHDVEVVVENDIYMRTFEAVIKKDGQIIETDPPKFNRGWRTANLKLTESGTYEIKVTFTDRKQDEPYELGPYKFTIDKTKPVVEVSEGIVDGKIYNGPQKFSVSVTEENKDESQNVLTIKHNGKVYRQLTGSNAFNNVQEITEDGVYEIDVTAVDSALNEDAFEPITFTIDQKAPDLNFNVSNNEYFNDEKEVVMSVYDELSLDLAQTKATVEKVGNTEYTADIKFNAISETTAEAKHKFKDNGNYIITLISKDKANNEVVTKKITFTIDQDPPDIVVTSIGDNGKYNQDRNVTINITDENMGDSSVTVTHNGNPYEIDELTLEGKTATTMHTFTEDGVYKLVVESTDKAGNHKAETINFTVDKNGPAIKYSIENGAFIKDNKVDLTISVEDYTPFVPEITVKRTYNGKTDDIKTGDWLEEIIWLITQKKTIQLEEEGVYSVEVEAKDSFGVVSTENIEFTIDQTSPVIEPSGIENGDFVKGDNELFINIKDLYVNPSKNEFLVNGNPVKDAEWKETATGYQLKQSFPVDGEYEVTVRSEDFAGNKSTKTHKFTVDTVKPKILYGNVEDGKYYDEKTKPTVTIKVNELNYKNNTVNIEVYRNEVLQPNLVKWENEGVESSFSIPFKDDGDYKIKVWAEDAAKNRTEDEIVEFTVDQTFPAVEISNNVEHMTNYNQTLPVKFEVTDTNIANISLSVTKNGKNYEIGSLKQNGTKASLQHNFAEEGSYVLYFNATDKSGNKTTHEEIAFIIDKTNPVVKIDGVDHQSFNLTGKRVTVSVDELNFGTNYVVLSVTKDGKVFNIGTWKNNNKLSSLGYNFNDDGLYTIAISAEDKAGNGPITANKTFTIDTTKPAIEITGVENAAHYNVDKPVSVEIRDVNLDVNRITVTRNGRGYNAGGFGVANQTARLSHNFSQEGDYAINVEAIDKAGNQFSRQIAFTIDKTAPVITPKFKGQSRVIKNGEYINEVFTPEFALDQGEDTIVSVTMNGRNVTGRIPTATLEMKYDFSVLARDKAGNESTIDISFILDTTKPNLNITGVIDGFFNNNQMPTVTYSDRYLDSSRSSVTLNGRPFVNGVQLSEEGDYILKAEIYDLANNVSSRTIVFTIDKTAPVIKFKEAISEGYFKESLLPELLIEDLNAYDIISQTLNGQPYNLGDPIEEEGKHVLFFEVKDKAGNIQQLSVEFIIDKTPPKVVVDGVKKNETYRDPVTLSISLDNPSDTLKSVMINGELFNGEVKDVNGTKVISVTLSDINKYKVEVLAEDEAGNEMNEVVEFEIVEKSVLVKFYENKPLFAGAMVGLVGIAAAGAVALRRTIIRRKDEKDM